MKIVVVDDHPLVRKGLTSILTLEHDFEIVGEAASVNEAIKVIEDTGANLVLVDLKLGDESGLKIIKSLGIRMDCKYIILTSSANEEDFRKAQELGADGYVLKEALPEELLYAIKLVGKGRRYYDPGLMELMIREDEDNPVEELTPRELDVLIALGKGYNNSLIAKKLFITEFTVKKHVSQIFSKLNLTDRTQAALYANAKGLVNSFR